MQFIHRNGGRIIGIGKGILQMRTLSLVWGLLALLATCVAFLPGAEWLNLFNIPFAGIGVLLGVFALTITKNPAKGGAITGVILCMVAAVIGLIKFIMGGLMV